LTKAHIEIYRFLDEPEDETTSDLDDVTVGVLGVGADEDGEEGRGAVVGPAQDLLEVVLVPGAGQGPTARLGTHRGQTLLG